MNRSDSDTDDAAEGLESKNSAGAKSSNPYVQQFSRFGGGPVPFPEGAFVSPLASAHNQNHRDFARFESGGAYSSLESVVNQYALGPDLSDDMEEFYAELVEAIDNVETCVRTGDQSDLDGALRELFLLANNAYLGYLTHEQQQRLDQITLARIAHNQNANNSNLRNTIVGARTTLSYRKQLGRADIAADICRPHPTTPAELAKLQAGVAAVDAGDAAREARKVQQSVTTRSEQHLVEGWQRILNYPEVRQGLANMDPSIRTLMDKQVTYEDDLRQGPDWDSGKGKGKGKGKGREL